MKLTIVLMILTAATVFANTHVNIAFTQQQPNVGTKAAEPRNDKAQLKASDSSENLNSGEQNARFARIQAEDKKVKADFENDQNVDSADSKDNKDSTSEYRSERVQNDARSEYFGTQPHNQQRGFYSSNQGAHQNNGQFRNASPQDMRNMEFERYIQHYHSGPTVETVYESAKPEMQHTLNPSARSEQQRVVKFERLVVSPAKEDSVQPSSDSVKPVVSHQPTISSSSASVITPSIPAPSPPVSLSPQPVPSASSSSGNGFKVNLSQNPSSVGKDGYNFDLSYNKPSYNEPSYKYNDGHSDAHFYNQFPPSVEEPRSGYGDYYGSIYSRQQVGDGYHPVEQRPLVTKTIQIAQPAIKAKKYEVRHPAIQKEFYDIEERVVIKPAGTVVVELERPSAKILKEETTLPLGHPHPAVAAAYTPNRNTQSFSNIIYSNSGSSSANHPGNQYLPAQNYNNNNAPDHHSTIVAPSTYDQSSKELDVNQNKPYSGENHFSAASTAESAKPQSREIVVVTDSHGNQRQMTADQFAYGRDETDKASPRQVYNHRSSMAFKDSGRSNGQSNISPQRSGFKANFDDIDRFKFDAEYISNSGNTHSRNENKPARLQEASSRVVEQKQQQPIIKHEHRIVLSPSQHNIYLSRNQEVPKTKYVEETAQVREIKPYLQNHRGSVVVYASPKQSPEVKYVPRTEFKPQARVLQYNSPQKSQSSDSDNRVQYSAPYAQLRHHSDAEQQQRQIETHNNHKSEKLIVEDKPAKDEKKAVMENTMEKQAPQAHIEIKIPHSLSHEAKKGIVVNSALRPMMMDNDRVHNSKLEISVTNKEESQQTESLKDEPDNSDQSDMDSNNKKNFDDESENLSSLKTKPDCDQSSTQAESENYELASEYNSHGQQKFMRIVETPKAAATSTGKEATSSAESAAVQSNIQPQNIDVNHKSSAGHITPPGSRVLAATPALKESTPSESFHKRRIVVNHPFQTVREVVEHEPYTNYHEVQVNEPATPALYQSANYYQPHGHSENAHSYYH